MTKEARKTVKLPDGFNGSTMLFNVTPVEVDGHLAKLSCAEPGKEYLIRWIGRSELQNHINAQDLKEFGYLQHGTATGPLRTEIVAIKNEHGDRWLAFFEGKWRRVHVQVNRTYITFGSKKITIQIEGV